MTLDLTPVAAQYLTGGGIRPVHRATVKRGETININGIVYLIRSISPLGDGLRLELIESAGRPISSAERRQWDDLEGGEE